MKKTNKKTAFALIALLLVLAAVGSSFAWYLPLRANFGNAHLKGTIRSNYFEHGAGTEDDPYVIARPVQMYNFAWLQYLGYLDGANIRLLDPEDYAGEDKATSFMTNEGDPMGSVLNMTGYSLPPVGTEAHPFSGSFEGQGKTVANLNVCANIVDATGTTSTVSLCDVGFFGFVSDGANIQNLYLDNITLNLSGASVVAVPQHLKNGETDETAVAAHTVAADSRHYDFTTEGQAVYTGYIAGHIKTGTTVENVFINNCSIIGGSAAVNNFGYFGCVEDTETGEQVMELGEEVAKIRTAGDDAGFGGSIDMESMYDRVIDVRNAARNNSFAYHSSKMIVIDEVAGTKNIYFGTTDLPQTLDGYKRTAYSVPDGGTYMYSDDNQDNYMYMTGLAYRTMPVTTYTYTTEFLDAIKIKNGDYYLNCSYNGELSAGADGTAWVMDENGRLYTIYSAEENEYFGSCYYLTVNNGALTTVSSAPTGTWTKDDESGKLSYTDGNGTVWYLTLRNGAWTVWPSDHYLTIGNGTQYLGSTGNSVNARNAGEWVLEDGKLYTVANGRLSYLNGNGSSVSTSNTCTTNTWAYDSENDRLSYTSGGKTYYLCHDGTGWLLSDTGYYSINTISARDGNTDRYLNVNNTTIEAGTNAGQATQWAYDSSTGYVTTVIGGNTYYLTANGIEPSVSRTVQTAWDYDQTSGKLSLRGNGNYALVYNNGWKVADTTASYYSIRYSNSHYLDATTEKWLDSSSAVYWKFDTDGHISKLVDGTEYFLAHNLSLSSTPASWTLNSDDQIYYRDGSSNYYIRYRDSTWSTNTSSYYRATRYGSKTTYSPANVTMPHDVPYNMMVDVAASGTLTQEHSYEDGQVRVVTQTASTEKIDTPNYFPLRVVSNDEGYSGGTSVNEKYVTSSKNTGYIVSGSYGSVVSDIRISRYQISNNISSCYSTRDNKFTKVYYTDDNGRHELDSSHKTEVYLNAEEQLLEVLNGETYVYGLHFMNSEISTENLTVADEVTVVESAGADGVTYYNYQLPEDSIDFNVVEKGTISFFAGTYYNNNDAFFSLHLIERNPDDKTEIKNIYEILEVYKLVNKTTGKDIITAPYVYKYKTEDDHMKYTDIDGNCVGLDALPDPEDESCEYVSVFKTEWITAPKGISGDKSNSSSSNNNVYYYEVPCNKGEYALGSVSGKTGAYLIYLDIATNGGDLKDSFVSGDGNEIVDLFKVDVRSAANLEETWNHSILQFAVDAPGVTNSSDYSVNVSFDGPITDEGCPYPKGIYTVNVVNKSDTALLLYVFLVDDDDNLANAFEYAYRVNYVTGDSSGTVIHNFAGIEKDYFQSCTGFTIPAAGAVTEFESYG